MQLLLVLYLCLLSCYPTSIIVVHPAPLLRGGDLAVLVAGGLRPGRVAAVLRVRAVVLLLHLERVPRCAPRYPRPTPSVLSEFRLYQNFISMC